MAKLRKVTILQLPFPHFSTLVYPCCDDTIRWLFPAFSFEDLRGMEKKGKAAKPQKPSLGPFPCWEAPELETKNSGDVHKHRSYFTWLRIGMSFFENLRAELC